jgi:steroid delta-isomerase-like uncharacterized protein
VNRAAMDLLIEQHLKAEAAGDTDGCVAMYTDDVVHDVVGSPLGALRGPDAAKHFYEFLTSNVHVSQMQVNHIWYGDDFCVTEHQVSATVPGEFLGIAGHGRPINHRLLHVFEFTNGKISRENVWIDSGAIVAQLTQA